MRIELTLMIVRAIVCGKEKMIVVVLEVEDGKTPFLKERRCLSKWAWHLCVLSGSLGGLTQRAAGNMETPRSCVSYPTRTQVSSSLSSSKTSGLKTWYLDTLKLSKEGTVTSSLLLFLSFRNSIFSFREQPPTDYLARRERGYEALNLEREWHLLYDDIHGLFCSNSSWGESRQHRHTDRELYFYS